MDNNSELWVDKYNPKIIDDIILEESQKEFFRNIIKSKKMSSLCLAGVQGCGKSTLARLLAKELDAVTLFIPCGTNGNIDTVRTTITEFAQSKSIEGNLKCIILDEFDSASGALAAPQDDDGKANNNTMKAMRSLIDEHLDDTRFILTCNYLNKIIAPIQSRCPPIKLTFSHKDVLLRIKKILDSELIKYDKNSLTDFLNTVIKKNFPDIRRIISILQNQCSTGTLIVSNTEDLNISLDLFAKELYESINVKKPTEIRQFVIQNKHLFNEEYSKLAGLILTLSLDKITIEKTKKIIEYIFRIDRVIDPEIQFFGMILELYN